MWNCFRLLVDCSFTDRRIRKISTTTSTACTNSKNVCLHFHISSKTRYVSSYTKICFSTLMLLSCKCFSVFRHDPQSRIQHKNSTYIGPDYESFESFEKLKHFGKQSTSNPSKLVHWTYVRYENNTVNNLHGFTVFLVTIILWKIINCEILSRDATTTSVYLLTANTKKSIVSAMPWNYLHRFCFYSKNIWLRFHILFNVCIVEICRSYYNIIYKIL